VPDAIYFCVADRQRNVCGYAWRLWWGGTSFYAKARYTPLAGIKLSMHGQDSRPGRTSRRPGFKVDLDRDALRRAEAAQGAIAPVGMSLPTWFSGAPVPKTRATHVLRFRTAWDMFAPDVPSAPNPGPVRSGAFAALVPVPQPGYAVDVDVYVSRGGRPFWPNEQRARRDNACLGPLRNAAAEQLTGVVVKRPVLTDPTPKDLLPRLPPDGDRVRGEALQVDAERGFLWICEAVLSRETFHGDPTGGPHL
jgi:hypothetical protein